jgi:branched-chain amino acid aminotransferase
MMNRAQAYGDGLFETMRVSGGRLLHPEEHYFRLMAGMRILRLPIPANWSPDGWLADLGISALDPSTDYRLRLTVWRTGDLGYAPSEDSGIEWTVAHSELDTVGYPAVRLLDLGVFQEHRKSAGLLSNIKTTSAVLYVLAANFAQEQRVGEVLVLNPQNEVLEASAHNVFYVQGDRLITPPLAAGALRGVMREVVIGLAPELGLTVVEEVFSPFALQQAEEVWMTNAVYGVSAVRQFRKTSYRSARAASMQKLVQARSEVAQFQ